jgi:hypothetical protein
VPGFLLLLAPGAAAAAQDDNQYLAWSGLEQRLVHRDDAARVTLDRVRHSDNAHAWRQWADGRPHDAEALLRIADGRGDWLRDELDPLLKGVNAS